MTLYRHTGTILPIVAAHYIIDLGYGEPGYSRV